jgi:adenylate cyclase class IV
MIEVEKKFILTPRIEKHLKKGAKYLGEKVFMDTYFDKPDFELTKNDIWLRLRDKQTELKMPIDKDGEHSKIHCNRYEEFVGEKEVRQMLNIPSGTDLLSDLKTSGYISFVSITTRREKFQKQQFNIDIDACDFGYTLAEVELMVEKEEQIEDAEKQIAAFITQCGLKVSFVRGKVVEYLYRKRPEHYKILLEEGVIVE